ncbi:MAG: UvrD-helicase domain-containing protein [Verrucomicrobia bacterium]|nr:UvrD-helicase domain-containing protein [Verrucomicrobiota bacterium]
MLDLGTLNPQQRLAVETLNGPVLILAGAGTGKTRVITTRIGYLVAKGIAPGNILGVTFTNKAAREMQARVTRLLPKSRTPHLAPRGSVDSRPSTLDPRPTICTFHSLCARILRQYIDRLGYKRNFVIYDESDQLGAIKKILAGISAKGEKTDPAAILSLLSRFRNGGERAAVFADPSVRAMAQHVRKRYESALRACNAVDFDDLILLVLRLFTEHPDVLEACRAKYRYVMVDEYQDTNAAQFQLVHLLTVKHRNLCVVGDDDQSIYGWRGAEIANLLDMEKHFPEVKVIKLEQNYRSTNTILTAANALIKNNVRRRAKQLWSQKGHGDKISVHHFTDDEEEARSIVAQIEFARMAHGVPWAHNAILFRTNQQSRPLETAMRQANVRYHLIGGQSFFDRREVRDLLAYLKMFLNPNDDVSLLRIANVPARGLSDVTMERLLGASHERKASVFATMKNPAVTVTFQARTREAIESFVAFVARTRATLHTHEGSSGSPLPAAPSHATGGAHGVARPTLQGWAEHFLDEAGYYAELRRSEKDREAAENRGRNLKDFIATMDAARPASGSLLEGLEAFLEDVSLDTDREDEEENKGDAVTLITMHSCKGLEFPRVYIVGLEDGLLPHSRSKTEGTLDEERRLFYVAVTRAMQTLAISHCGGRKKYGQVLPCHPSPFLQELPAELVEHEDEHTHRPVSAETGRSLFAAMRKAAQ